MYHRFYGLDHDPFRLTPSAATVYHHPSFERARAYLEYALMQAEGFVAVTGPPGSGKTTLAADLIAHLPAATDVAHIVTSRLDADDLLRMVAAAFDLTPAHRDKACVLETLHKDLARRAAADRRNLLVVDEAQELSTEALEELRLLTNLATADKPLLQVVLLGQHSLRERLQRPEMERLHQRLIACCRLEPLTEEQTRAYVHYRLDQAGWQGDPAFTDPVLRLLHAASGGVPRRINLLAGRLLMDAFAAARHRVGVADLRGVLEEMQEEALETEWRPLVDELAAEEGRLTGTAPGKDANTATSTAGQPTASPPAATETNDTRMPDIGVDPLDHAWQPEVESLPPLDQPHRDKGEPPREPILTDVISPREARDGNRRPGHQRPAERDNSQRHHHTTRVVATMLAVVALIIVVAAATPVFDGLQQRLNGWVGALTGTDIMPE
ncbi:AAA family ATPase [Arhodomonas sp. AD133]|uniref:ExeA family protein n=1 Tax=Arhodomonas sp. AD133 TaxID=3415009 RepID=UPI003EBA21BD